jgi:hypothetical protein
MTPAGGFGESGVRPAATLAQGAPSLVAVLLNAAADAANVWSKIRTDHSNEERLNSVRTQFGQKSR